MPTLTVTTAPFAPAGSSPRFPMTVSAVPQTSTADAVALDAPRSGPAAAHVHVSKRNPSGSKHIPALDGLRGLAILLVLVFHFVGLVQSQLPWLVQRTLAAGWVGVDLFFVLSGFLITSILCEAKGSAGYFKNFYMRRVLRIFPLYYGVLILAAVLAAIFHDRLSPEYQNVSHHQWVLWVYLQNFFAMDWKGFGHFWSLAVEEHFYMVWPAVVFFLSRRAAIWVCVVMIVSALGIRVGREFFVPPDQHAEDLWREATYAWTLCRMDALAIGSLLALVSAGVPAAVAKFRRASVVVLVFAALVCAAIFATHGTFSYKVPALQTVGFTVIGFGAAGLLVLTVTATPTSLLGRGFNMPVMRFLGKYSYGTYVFHMFVMSAMREWMPAQVLRPYLGGREHPNLSLWSAFAIYVVGGILVSLGIALLSWHLYEKHFLKLKRFFEYRAPTLEGFKANEPVVGGEGRGQRAEGRT